MMNIGVISNPTLKVKPSKKLYSYIENNVKVRGTMPTGISGIVFKNKVNEAPNKICVSAVRFLTDEDIDFINQLEFANIPDKPIKLKPVDTYKDDKLLMLKDLHWLYEYITDVEEGKVYFHKLFEGSEIILPRNNLIPRNQELEKRCQQYKNEFSNKEYIKMTQKISGSRNRYPQDTISYQLREMNKQIIAILQFIITVLAGFFFGFTGIEVFIGNLDLGFRLLLGIICGLLVALAELYFFAKKLNQNVMVELETEQRIKTAKLD